MREMSIKETETYKEFDILLNGEVIGSAEIKYPDMTLNNFFLYPQYRGKGYGQEAVKHFVEDFGVTNLWVNRENEIAKHIYEKNGFAVDGEPIFVAMRLKGSEGDG